MAYKDCCLIKKQVAVVSGPKKLKVKKIRYMC